MRAKPGNISLVESLLLLRVTGQVVEEEGGGRASRVYPGIQSVDGHHGGDDGVRPAPSAELRNDGVALLGGPGDCCLDVFLADIKRLLCQS